MKKNAYLLIFTLFCLTITGCTVRFMYNQMDMIVPWYVKSYIDLNKGQSRFLKNRVNFHLRWHRDTQLPEYIAVLQQAKAIIDQPELEFDPTLTDLSALRQEIKRLSRELSKQVAPDLAELFLTASDEQLHDMYKRFEKDNKRYQKRYIDAPVDEIRQIRKQEMQAQIERWIGGMTPEQKRLLKAWKAAFIPIGEHMLTYRKRWQDRFRDIMSQHHNSDIDVKPDLIALFSHPNQGWHNNHQASMSHNTQQASELFTNILLTLTKRQKRRMIKKLDKLAANFTELANERN